MSKIQKILQTSYVHAPQAKTKSGHYLAVTQAKSLPIEFDPRSFEKILDSCNPDNLVTLTNSCVNSSVVHSADLSAILAALIAAKLRKGDVNSDEEKLGLCSALLSVLGAARIFEVQGGNTVA